MIDQNTVKEIAEQLSLLYGHAVTDVMPIVLNAISLISMTSVACALIVISLITFIGTKIVPPLKEHILDDRADTMEVLVLGSCAFLTALIPIAGLYVAVYSLGMNILYSIAPHTYIIKQVLSNGCM